MYRALVITLSAAFLLLAYPATAHPGNTAADGCHYCRTNCDKWGVTWNERHCHNAKSVPAPLPPVSTPKPATPTPIVRQSKLPTPLPATITPVSTSTPTIEPTITPEPTSEPVEEEVLIDTREEIEPSFSPVPTIEALPTVEPRKPSAWVRFRLLLGSLFGRR